MRRLQSVASRGVGWHDWGALDDVASCRHVQIASMIHTVTEAQSGVPGGSPVCGQRHAIQRAVGPRIPRLILHGFVVTGMPHMVGQ